MAIKLIEYAFAIMEVIVRKLIFFIFLTGSVFSSTILERTKNMQRMPGYITMYWDSQNGKVWLEVSRLDSEFLYVNSLTGGLGSNDIGLDRGQLGNNGKIVYFHKVGQKILLIQPNYKYRASSNDELEKKSVRDGFAQSTLWGFKIEAQEKKRFLIDGTDFFLRDAHGVIDRLKSQKMGNYNLNKGRSAIFKDGTINFRNNTEVESMVTFTGSGAGRFVRQVAPTAESLTLRMHHSLVKLPDNNYSPRTHDPRSGYFPMSFQDYAVPLDESIYIRYITRHRLEKKNPNAEKSNVVKPIIYYVDPGVPEPVKSAMIESGLWWNQAFEAAGFINAFQVKILPKDAHPMDVRYNMIHWVHRATRGWSYGSSVVDPRTGEIIKGNVSLGSLRLRQDYLIAEGLLAPYDNENKIPDDMKEIALMRVKQLVAHEIGHTIGLAHNYISSSQGRSSVMDYPHPTLYLNSNKEIVWENAYDDKIGAWDKITIAYGYQDFPKGTNEQKALEDIIQKGIKDGYTFITDKDSRPLGSAHPTAHLWDNGDEPVGELNNLLSIRQVALNNFGEKNIRFGDPYSKIEDVLVPIFFLHRYQIEGAAKVIGGLEFNYALRGDGQTVTKFLSSEVQIQALDGLLSTLQPDILTLNEDLLKILPPRASGRPRTRESFSSRTGVTFDGIGLAETAAAMSSRLIFHPERASRLVEYHARENSQPGLEFVIEKTIEKTILEASPKGLQGEVKRAIDHVVLDHLIGLSMDKRSSPAVQAIALGRVQSLKFELGRKKSRSNSIKYHNNLLIWKIDNFLNNPNSYVPIQFPKAPPGSPIGTEFGCTYENNFPIN